MTTDELHERLREAESTLLAALRMLAEVGDAEALCTSADMGAKHAAPLEYVCEVDVPRPVPSAEVVGDRWKCEHP